MGTAERFRSQPGRTPSSMRVGFMDCSKTSWAFQGRSAGRGLSALQAYSAART